MAKPTCLDRVCRADRDELVAGFFEQANVVVDRLGPFFAGCLAVGLLQLPDDLRFFCWENDSGRLGMNKSAEC